MSKTIHIPELEPLCGSWIVSRKNSEVIGEFFDRKHLLAFNPETCFIETALQYLVRINQKICAANI
jgi:hypothetical protein